MNTQKNKHMTFEDRLEIQEGLSHGMTFKAIAVRIGKDQTTVSKEVKKHIIVTPTSIKRSKEDGTPIMHAVCPSLLKPPFVCNPCKRRHQACAFDKHMYSAKHAHKEYQSLLTEAREGIPLNKETFYEMDRIISDGIKAGQHLYHILHTHELGVSKSTVYRHLKHGYLSVASIDFPRVVKFKPRTQRSSEYVPKAAKIGRTHEDFLLHIENNTITSWVEMDTVIGRVGGKVIMTLHFTFCNFMAGFLLDSKSAADVTAKLYELKSAFAENGFRFADVFPLLLTDNGGEFSDVSGIENGLYGAKESKLFFCDPYKSCQKPKVEKNHSLFRDIIPAGKPFDGFSQDIVNTIFSNINSVKRKILNGKTPYELFAFTYGETVAHIMGIRPIPADKVIQSPKLLNR